MQCSPGPFGNTGGIDSQEDSTETWPNFSADGGPGALAFPCGVLRTYFSWRCYSETSLGDLLGGSKNGNVLNGMVG